MTEQVTPAGAPGANSGVPQPPTAEPAKAPSKGRSVVKRLVSYGIGIVLVMGGILVYKFLTGDPDTAAVGNCLIGQNANDLKTIDCTDAKAEWKVVGKLDGKTEAESSSDTVCASFATAEAWFWKGEKGGTGYILCMEPVKK